MMTSIKEEVEDVKIKVEDIDANCRRDPTSFLPEEEMSYEIKKKKKKKKKKRQEDPFKDLDEKAAPREPVTIIKESALDPEVNIKVENIEVELDFNDFADNTGLMVEGPHSEDSQEPEVKIEPQNHEAVLLTFESIINDRNVLGYSQETQSAVNHVCKICHLIFQSATTLKSHQKRKHKIFRRTFEHTCDHCGMSYDQKNSLVAHIKRKHGPNAEDDREERACEICSLVFKGMNRLRMHMRRKHDSFQDSFNHECEHCGLTYDKHRSLIVHIQRKHSNKKKPVLNQWYNCPFCPKIFSKRETYVRHVQRKHQVNENGDLVEDTTGLDECINVATGEITCKECPLVFSSLTFLKLHMRRKHNALKEDFRLKCRICHLSYDKVESLKRHVRRKHDKKTYCDVCNKQFDTTDSYLNHTHMKSIKECTICGLIFASQGGLAKHLRCTHKMDKPKTVFCNLCNEGFSDKRNLKPHIMRVHLNVSYTCTYCKKVFKAKESYRRHVIFQHQVKNDINKPIHKCEHCTDTFQDENELCKHISIMHSNSNTEKPTNLLEIKKEEGLDVKESYQCTKCPDVYLNWDELRLHYAQNHYTVEETQCQVCGNIVPKNDLPKHIKSEHTSTLLNCKYCEFSSPVKASMTQHLLRHKNATTLNCDFTGCRYKTFYEDAMTKHKRKHADLGLKLQCARCGFQTMNKYILRYHEEAHATGKKRYTCNLCNYSTILPANLVQHKYKHSPEKRFKCEFCPFATKYNTSLRFHVKNKHCDLPTG